MTTVDDCCCDLNYTVSYTSCIGSCYSMSMSTAILAILLLISVVIHMVIVVFYCCNKKRRLRKVQSDQQNDESIGRGGREWIAYDVLHNEARVTAPVMKQNDAYGKITLQN